MKKRSKYRPRPARTYTMWETIMADPDQPLPLARREAQLDKMRAGLEGMRSAERPTKAHWEPVADCINLLETLVLDGELDDEGGWITEASREMAEAAMRSQAGQTLRLTNPGLVAVTNALEGHEVAITNLSARRMVEVHRKTEARIIDIRAGRGRPNDVQVVSL